jgi:hypothetical protein
MLESQAKSCEFEPRHPLHDVLLTPDYGSSLIGETSVPTISMFYGILIRMFFYDTDRHNLPHIHAEYQSHVAVYSIPDGTVLAGEIPSKKHKLVVAWIEIHQEDLIADWQLAVNGQKPFPIKGLD